MKKLKTLLLMLTLAFAITACGTEKVLSEYEQQKVTEAETRASNVINLAMVLVTGGDINELLENYNNIELSDLFASTYAGYTGDATFTCEGKAVNIAFTSFQSGIEEMGSIKEFGEVSSKLDGDTITVIVPVVGEKVNGSVELLFTNDIYLKMTSCTLNIDQTKGQLMGKAAMNTLLGMGTVFVVLILISLIIACFNYLPKPQAPAPKKAEPAVQAVSEVSEPEDEDLSDDMELVAVIAAAIATYEGTSVEGFRVRSIRRANTKSWKKA